MVTKLIETAVEIEGLLRIVKDGKPSDELYSLLTEKTFRLADECDKLAAEYDRMKQVPTEAEESKAAESASDEEAEAEEATAEAYQALEKEDATEGESMADESEVHEAPAEEQTPAEEEETQAEEETETVEEEQVEEETPEAEEETKEEETTTEAEENEEESAEDDEEYEAEQQSSEAYLQMDGFAEDEDEYDDDILLNLEEDEDAPEAVAEQPKPEHIQKPKPNLKAFFSLNDRFLYARELFDGDMKMFDATLRQLEGIEYFSDIEDYFFNELEWDPERRFVSQYIDTLRPHFK